jgi:hypothetical protein
MSTSEWPALRRGLVVALVVWVGISVEVVRSNVVYPSTADDDGVSVLVAYLVIAAALIVAGMVAQSRSSGARGPLLAGALAGAVIGALTIGTYAVVDNLYLSTISLQQAKIDGLAGSGMTSMREYVNVSLAYGLVVLTGALGVLGAGLGLAGGALAKAMRRTR